MSCSSKEVAQRYACMRVTQENMQQRNNYMMRSTCYNSSFSIQAILNSDIGIIATNFINMIRIVLLNLSILHHESANASTEYSFLFIYSLSTTNKKSYLLIKDVGT
jgi:hypothetical protein